MKKAVSLALVFATLCLLLVSCGANAIVGTWTGMWEGSAIEISFEKDGVCGYKLDGRSYLGNWKAVDGSLTVTIDEIGETRTFIDNAPYEVDENVFTVTVDSKQIKFTKQK